MFSITAQNWRNISQHSTSSSNKVLRLVPPAVCLPSLLGLRLSIITVSTSAPIMQHAAACFLFLYFFFCISFFVVLLLLELYIFRRIWNYYTFTILLKLIILITKSTKFQIIYFIMSKLPEKSKNFGVNENEPVTV